MELTVNPLQPFRLLGESDVSMQYLQSLALLYQPIIGSQAFSLYLTLSAMNVWYGNATYPLRHQMLLEEINCGINDLNEARKRLEAVGLLNSYRDISTHSKTTHQLIVYQLKLPLTPENFSQDALLSTALLNSLGEQSYTRLMGEFQQNSSNEDSLVDETATFQDIFRSIPVQDKNEAKVTNRPRNYSSSFNYSLFLENVMSEGINHKELTLTLKDQIYALHDIYNYNESDLANFVFMVTDKRSGKINLEDLRKLADKRKATKESKTPEINTTTVPSNKFPYIYTEKELEERIKNLAQSYPDLSKEDRVLVTMCEQLPLNTFLIKIKKAKNGFATDSEQFYIKDLKNRFNLKPEVINFLVYYLLIILNKPNLYKGDLQRFANEWQQKNLDNVPKAIIYITQEETVKVIKKQQNQKTYNRKQRSSRHKEIIPSWMTESDATETTEVRNDTPRSMKHNEQDIRKRLDRLIEEEGDE